MFYCIWAIIVFRILNTSIFPVAKIPADNLRLFIIAMCSKSLKCYIKRIIGRCDRYSFKTGFTFIWSSYLYRFTLESFTAAIIEYFNTYFIITGFTIFMFYKIGSCIIFRVLNTGVGAVTKLPADLFWFFIIVM